MTIVLYLLAMQGTIGAFDTIYYHEWRGQLPAHAQETGRELKIHAARDFFYSILFGTLPWLEWHGIWTIVLAGILITEIILTLTDFGVEITARKTLGDVYAGERVTHAVMGILYGVIIAHLIPVMLEWWAKPTALVPATANVAIWLQWLLSVMAVGVAASGVRDLYAAFQLPYGGFPWAKERKQF